MMNRNSWELVMAHVTILPPRREGTLKKVCRSTIDKGHLCTPLAPHSPKQAKPNQLDKVCIVHFHHHARHTGWKVKNSRDEKMQACNAGKRYPKKRIRIQEKQTHNPSAPCQKTYMSRTRPMEPQKAATVSANCATRLPEHYKESECQRAQLQTGERATHRVQTIRSARIPRSKTN